MGRKAYSTEKLTKAAKNSLPEGRAIVFSRNRAGKSPAQRKKIEGAKKKLRQLRD